MLTFAFHAAAHPLHHPRHHRLRLRHLGKVLSLLQHKGRADCLSSFDLSQAITDYVHATSSKVHANLV